jgi:hypothetical protein
MAVIHRMSSPPKPRSPSGGGGGGGKKSGGGIRVAPTPHKYGSQQEAENWARIAPAGGMTKTLVTHSASHLASSAAPSASLIHAPPANNHSHVPGQVKAPAAAAAPKPKAPEIVTKTGAKYHFSKSGNKVYDD